MDKINRTPYDAARPMARMPVVGHEYRRRARARRRRNLLVTAGLAILGWVAVLVVIAVLTGIIWLVGHIVNVF